MALINRISRLVKADFHAVLDQIEEPEQLLKQAIRDMEHDLTETERHISLCAHEQEALIVRKRELESSIKDIDGQLDLCFKSGKEVLAKGQVRKKLEAERVLKRLQAKFEANEAYLEEQRATLEENRATLDGLRQKAELFLQRTSSQVDNVSEFDDVSWMARELNVSADEVEIAFLREKSARGAS